MSDDDDCMFESDGEGSFDENDFEEVSSNDESDVDTENQYYNSKGLKETDVEGALKGLAKVVELQGSELSEWGFKALKQQMKLYFKMAKYDIMTAKYKELLTYVKSAVTRNYSEKSINTILDYVCEVDNTALLEEFYRITLAGLMEVNNERLLFKTNLKLGNLYLNREDYKGLVRVLSDLHKSCQLEDGTPDSKKGTQQLEICALEIQMYTKQKNFRKLKDLYEQSLNFKSAIPRPLDAGIIRECGGKMHMRDGQWADAHTDFFESFKSYDESGSQRRIQCLKYLVLANMLMESTINPFDSQEAKPYKEHPQIVAMRNLVGAFQHNDIRQFEKILANNCDKITDDPFMKEYIDDLLTSIRTQVILKAVKPYDNIRLDALGMMLNISPDVVEKLLVLLLLEGRLKGSIDQVSQVFHKKVESKVSKFDAMSKWAESTNSLLDSILTARLSSHV